MSKRKEVKNNVIEETEDSYTLVIPMVDNNEPKIKIYDAANDNSYWYRKIGFNRKITDDD